MGCKCSNISKFHFWIWRSNWLQCFKIYTT